MLKSLRYAIPVAAVVLIASGPTLAAELAGEELGSWDTTYEQLVNMSPKWGIQSPEAFKTATDAGVPVFFLDVRTPAEWEGGIVEGATTVTLVDLPSEAGVAALPDDKGTIIGVYCKSGHRSALALTLLHQLGYTNAISMSGGFQAWDSAGYPVVEAQ